MIIVETTSGLAGNLVTCLFACTSAGLMKIFWITKGGFAGIFESSDTRYSLLSRCSSCFTKKSEFVLSFLLILIVPCLSTCVIYTSSSNLVAQRASSLSELPNKAPGAFSPRLPGPITEVPSNQVQSPHLSRIAWTLPGVHPCRSSELYFN